jgi:hypothetical protein
VFSTTSSTDEGPRLDIIPKESMLDWSAYQEVKLDTELVTSLGIDMLLYLLGFLPEVRFLNLFLLFSNLANLFSKFSFGGT